MKAVTRISQRWNETDVWLMQRPWTGLFVLIAVVLCAFRTDVSYAQYKDNRELWGLQDESSPNNEDIPGVLMEDGQVEQTVYHASTETMHMVYFVKRGSSDFSFAHRSYSFAYKTYTNAVASAWVSTDDDQYPLALSAAVDINGDIGVLMAFGRRWTTSSGGQLEYHSEIRLYYDLFDPVGSAWLLSPLSTPPSPTQVFMNEDPGPPILPGVTDDVPSDCAADAWDQPVNIWLSFDGDKPTWAIGVGDMYGLSSSFFCAACACEPTAPDTETEGRLFYARSPVVPGVTPVNLELNKEYVEVDQWTATATVISNPFGGFIVYSSATTGGVAFEEDDSGTAKIAYSTLGLNQNSQLMYAEVDSSWVISNFGVLDENIETDQFDGAIFPTPKKRIRLSLDTADDPRVAYEKRRGDPGIPAEYNEVWYVEPAVSPLFPQLVLSRPGTVEIRVAEILMDPNQDPITGRPGDPHLNEDRTLQVVAYGVDLRGSIWLSPKNLVVSLPKDTDADAFTPWNREFGLNNFRYSKGIGAAIDDAIPAIDSGSVRVVGLRTVGWQDDGFQATEASNLYVKLEIVPGICGCDPPLPITDLELTLTGLGGTPVIHTNPDFEIISNGVNLNNWVLKPVLPQGDYELYVTDVVNGNYIQVNGGMPGPNLVTIAYSVPDAQVVQMGSIGGCLTCDCGAAPLYPGAVVLDSFGNAVLPLIPALFALGVWAMARRRKSNS